MKRMTIKQLREKRGLTQEELAKLINKTVTFVSLLENGKRNASDDTKKKLSKVFGCDISDIFLALNLTDG